MMDQPRRTNIKEEAHTHTQRRRNEEGDKSGLDWPVASLISVPFLFLSNLISLLPMLCTPFMLTNDLISLVLHSIDSLIVTLSLSPLSQSQSSFRVCRQNQSIKKKLTVCFGTMSSPEYRLDSTSAPTPCDPGLRDIFVARKTFPASVQKKRSKESFEVRQGVGHRPRVSLHTCSWWSVKAVRALRCFFCILSSGMIRDGLPDEKPRSWPSNKEGNCKRERKKKGKTKS